MRVSTVLLAVAASFAAAQNLKGEPTCATSCLSSAISAIGCAATDQGCQCGTSAQAALTTVAGPCLAGACSPGDLLSALSVGSALCMAYSSGLNATTTASTASTTLVSTSTSTVVAVTTSVPLNGTTTSGTGSITSKATITTGAGSSSTGTGGGSSSSSISTAGGALNKAYAGGVLGMILGAVAVL